MHLYFDVQANLNNNVSGLAVSYQEPSVADKDDKRIQVPGEPLSLKDYDQRSSHIRLNHKGISPKPTVYTLRPGECLRCGIGVSADSNVPYDLSSLDIRRWTLGASAIVEISKSSPRIEYALAETLKIDHLDDFMIKHDFYEAFNEYIPNFPKDMLGSVDIGFLERELLLKETGIIFLFMLRFFIPLTAAYGGVHLSAWNFGFPSRLESIIWRAACFIIMGSPFALLAVRGWVRIYIDFKSYFDRLKNPKLLEFLRIWRIDGVLGLQVSFPRIACYGSAGLLLLCYAASRLYLVVESFISLRHVPIGVYAAVPWVQNIPHV